MVLALICPRLTDTAGDAIASLRIEQVPRVEQPLADNAVRVSARAASLNFPDMLRMMHKYQEKTPHPFVPCQEGAGVVTEVGPAVTDFKPGDRVFYYFPFGTGAASAEVVIPDTIVYHLADSLDFKEGAVFNQYATGYHALVDRGELKPGEWLMVTGAAGGMGLAAVQLGKALGARVIAAASSEEKLAVCKQVITSQHAGTNAFIYINKVAMANLLPSKISR